MPDLPIFYFTYADPDSDLEHTVRERKAHHDLLIPRFLCSHFGFFQNQDFTKDNLNFGFEEFLDKVTIFHFSGHAGMGEIKLQDGSTFIDGIAAQMKMALSKKPLPKLVLTFLNGCSTESMVSKLLQAGVPVVIGTSAPVEDGIAADFSINFYEALLKDQSIREAFDYSVSKLQTVNNTIKITRGVGFETSDRNVPLWGIFYPPNKRNLIDWKLSDFIETQNVDSGEYIINSITSGSMYNSLYKASVSRIVDLENRRLKGEDIREDINSALANCYPGPIAFKIGRLLTVEIDNRGKSVEEIIKIHLNNLYDVYQSLTELLFIIMLSQFWDKCLSIDNENQIKPILPVDYRRIGNNLDEIKEFFVTTREQRRYFDYVPKIKAIREIFDKEQIEYFLDELKQLKISMKTDPDFISSYEYFNNLREILKDNQYNQFNNNQWENYCKAGEQALVNFFNIISFCVRYDFGVLKNIELMLPRFKSKPTYLYKLLKIPKSGSTTYYSSDTNLTGFTSVRSIVMLKSENFDKQEVQKISGLINLSPFVLDLNITDPRANKGNLLIYSHYDRDSGNYVYEEALSANSQVFIKPNTIIFEELDITFNTFFEVFFNENVDSIK